MTLLMCRFRTPEEEQRAGMILTVLFMLMIMAQLGLVYWKKKRYKSYLQVTLDGLWVRACAMRAFACRNYHCFP